MLLMEGAIKQGVKRIRLHVLSGESAESGWMSARGRAVGSSCDTGIAACFSLRLGVTVFFLFQFMLGGGPGSSHAGRRPWQFLSTSPPHADGRDVNDDTAVAWVERLHGDCSKLSAQHSVDVSERGWQGRHRRASW